MRGVGGIIPKLDGVGGQKTNTLLLTPAPQTFQPPPGGPYPMIPHDNYIPEHIPVPILVLSVIIEDARSTDLGGGLLILARKKKTSRLGILKGPPFVSPDPRTGVVSPTSLNSPNTDPHPPPVLVCPIHEQCKKMA